MACCKPLSKKTAKIALCITLVVLVISIVVLVMFPTIYNSVLKKEISLEEGSLVTGIWKDIPLPIREKLYFFNITNGENFVNGIEPLNVTEVGPYTYKSRWVKTLFWNPNHTVSYREVRTYEFLRNDSFGSQDDEIYTLNGPLIIAASIASSYDDILRALLSSALAIEGETIVTKKTIKELVYEGYEDFIIKYAPIVKPDIPYKDGKFSWLYGKNATDDGLFTVFTGSDDPSKKGILINLNGEERLTFWKEDRCNMLNGTSIEVGPPIDGDPDSYTFFQTIFCRSFSFNFTEDIEHFGIPSKRFRPTRSLLANSTENPDNACFEVEKERPSGLLDISPCQFGAPVFISFPHFYLADPSYLKSVNTLNPNDEEHGSHVDVEPITGVTVDIVVRFQINVEITKVTGIFQTYKPTKGMFPIFWVELNLQIDEDYANFMKHKTRDPKIIAYSVLGSLVVICCLVSIIWIVVLCSPDKDDDEPLLSATDEDSPYFRNNYASTASLQKDIEREISKNINNSHESANNDLYNDK